MTITLRRWRNNVSNSVIEIIISVEAQEKVETRCHPVWNELMMTSLLHPVDHRTQGDQRPGKARRPEGPRPVGWTPRRSSADPRRFSADPKPLSHWNIKKSRRSADSGHSEQKFSQTGLGPGEVYPSGGSTHRQGVKGNPGSPKEY